MGGMMTTFEIDGVLLHRAERRAEETGQPLRAVIEEGLRLVLEKPAPTGYQLPDLSVGDPNGPNPLEKFTFAEMLELSDRDFSMFPQTGDEGSPQGSSES